MAITLDGSNGVTTPRAKVDTATGYNILQVGSDDSTGYHLVNEGSGLNVYQGAIGAGSKHLGIDSAGRVTMPYQPYSWISTDGHTTGTLTGGTRVVDNASMYNTTNGRFTVPVNGHYAIYYNLYCASSGQQEIMVRRNGTNIRYFNNIISQPAYTGGSGYTVAYLYAGDYIEYYNNKGDVRSSTSEGYGIHLLG